MLFEVRKHDEKVSQQMLKNKKQLKAIEKFLLKNSEEIQEQLKKKRTFNKMVSETLTKYYN